VPVTCHFLKGDVVITPEEGEPVVVGKGDFGHLPCRDALHLEGARSSTETLSVEITVPQELT
jgi:hypothetical protein